MKDPREYDVIIVGARLAGLVAATALARRGYAVLALERSSLRAETLATPVFGREAVAVLDRLGLWQRVSALGAPPLTTLRHAAIEEGVAFEGAFSPVDGFDAAYSIPRSRLDPTLAEGARAAGVEVHEETTVSGLLHRRGGVVGVRTRGRDAQGREYRARAVIGADGRHSLFARWVRARTYDYQRPLAPVYYGYFSNVSGPRNRLDFLHTHARDYLVAPSDAGLTCIAVFLPSYEFASYRLAYQQRFMEDLAAVPELAERLRDATPAGRIVGIADLESYVRLPYGPGWALTGDAGLCLHPITVKGMDFAVRDGEAVAVALDAAFSATFPFEHALDAYRASRDAASELEYRHAVAMAALTGQELPTSILALWSALALQPDDASRVVSEPAGAIHADELRAIIAKARELVAAG